MTVEELTQHLRRVKELAQSSTALPAALAAEGKTSRAPGIAAKRKALLDTL